MFKFKQFTVIDDVSAMKIGTDSVLLGSWALGGGWHGEHVIDAGSGTGVISLMLAQRFDNITIDSVEIDEKASIECGANIDSSPWSNRIKVHNADFLHFGNCDCVDAIVSNPPFYSEPILSPDHRRSLARHGDNFEIKTLIDRATVLLKPGGHLSIVAPWRRKDEFMYKMTMCHLDPCRMCDVISTPYSEPTRVLIEAVKGLAHCYDMQVLTIRGSNGRYSSEYRQLTQAFYLDSTFL